MPPTTPAHVIRLEPTPGRVTVRFAGQVVADTIRAITLYEGRLTPVQYVPLEDVTREYLVPSDHRTHCPFKGDAGYYDLVVGDRIARNAVWYYAEPYAGVASIARRIAFYPDRVDGIEIAAPAG